MGLGRSHDVPRPSWMADFKTSIPFFFKKKGGGGRAVHSMKHIVMCSTIFGKAKAVQEYVRKEDK